MKKSKLGFLSFLKLKKKVLIIFSGCLLILGLLALLIYGPLWSIWPLRIKSRVALNRLGVSCFNEPICHDNCFLKREKYMGVIARGLELRSFRKKIEGMIVDDQENICRRQELVRAYRKYWLDGNSAPQFLADYLANDQGDDALRKVIQKEFFNVFNFSVDDLKDRVMDDGLVIEKRLEALNLLISNNLETRLDYYFSVLKNDPDPRMKREVIGIISNLPTKDETYDLKYFKDLKTMITSSDTDKYVRANLLWLAIEGVDSDNEREVLDFLGSIFKFPESQVDKFSKFLLADSLKKITGKEYDVPQISENEWREYRALRD